MKTKLGLMASILGWIVIGYCNYHYTLGGFTARFPEQNNTGVSLAMAIVGPVAVPAVYLWPGDIPLVWLAKPYTCQQREAIDYKKSKVRYPTLDDAFIKETFLTYLAPDCRGEI